MQIKADGVAHFLRRGDRDDYYRAWLDDGKKYYRTSKRYFDNKDDAEEYGKRVAARFNRIFGDKPDVQP